MNVIETQGLTKRYTSLWHRDGTLAVDDLSLSIEAGQAFGFLGPNGAGKTTTIYLMLGLLTPTSGGGTLFGYPFGDPQGLRRVGFLPENINLHDYHSASGLLRYYGELSGLDAEWVKQRASYVLERLGLASCARMRVSRFSRGMLQRMGLAQAILGDSEMLILDEPTSSLDPVGRKEVKELLTELKAQGKTIFISSHILSEVESVCDQIGIVKQGRLIATGRLDELIKTEGGIRITSERLPEDAVKEIERAGGLVTESPTLFTIDLPDREREYDVIGILRKHGCPLISVEQRRESLEDVFFRLVKGEQPWSG